MPSPANLKNDNKIASLQALRAVAFLGIFLFHCSLGYLGAWGAGVFFVLSGFVLTYKSIMGGEKNNKYSSISLGECISFSVHKIAKLYPLHIIMLLVSIVLDYSSSIIAGSIKWGDLGLQVLFDSTLTQSLIPVRSIYLSLNSVSWFLSTSFIIYLFYPLIIKLIKRSMTTTNYAIISILIVYVIQIIIAMITRNISFEYCDLQHYITYICPFFRIGDFIIGCLLAIVYLKRKKSENENSKTLRFTALELGVVLLVIIGNHIYSKNIDFLGGTSWYKYSLLFTVSCTGCVWLFSLKTGLLTKGMTNKPMIYIGNLSGYAFLIHQVVIRITHGVLYVFFGTENSIILAIISLFITLCLAQVYDIVQTKIKAKKA